MAYATAEKRHQKQAAHEGSFSTEQKLMSYLRDKYSPESLESSYACEACENILAKVARDYDAEINEKHDDEYYKTLARGTITRYLKNWEDKVPGEDNRGKRLGKAQYAEDTWNTVKNTISGIHW